MIFSRVTRFIFSASLTLSVASMPLSTAAVEESELYVNPERLEEWNDWRFGLFIHWGPWAQREVGYIWKMVNEESKEEGSKSFDLWETFNPTEFNPTKWAKAAKAAGMKYVVFVVKHHDGVNNYDTQLSDFKTTNPIVPYHTNANADLTKAIVEAFRAEGLAVGLYYSHIDWHHPDGKYFARDHWEYDESRIDSDPESWHRFAEFQKNQVRELLTNYGKIDILWYDIHWPTGGTGDKVFEHPVVRKDVLELIEMMKSLQPDLIFNDRGTDKFGGFYTPEQQVPATGLPGFWESNITITNERGFWYKGDHVTAKSPEVLTRMLIEIAAKGGNFLMNVGPRPDGELSQTEYDALSGIGTWMEANGESIYGTDRSLFVDLPWGWSTTAKGKLYLHVFDWPTDGKLIVPGLQSGVKKAYLLEDTKMKSLAVRGFDDGKSITVGKHAPNAVSSVVVLELSEAPKVHNTFRQTRGESMKFSTAIAQVEGENASYNYGTATRKGNFVQDIKTSSDRIGWNFLLRTPGKYRVLIEYSAQNLQAGSEFALKIGDLATFNGVVRGTADWNGDLLEVQRQTFDAHERHNNLWTFQEHELGTLNIAEPGAHLLEIAPISIAKDYLAFVKSVTLELVE